jgi:hypothetical protein
MYSAILVVPETFDNRGIYSQVVLYSFLRFLDREICLIYLYIYIYRERERERERDDIYYIFIPQLSYNGDVVVLTNSWIFLDKD